MKILLIDNFDSFTYNIVELLRCVQIDDLVIAKNNITVVEASQFDKIILSPGPATPSESGNMLNIVQSLGPTHSILGICLGHQAIAQVYGATLRNLEKPFHGYQTEVNLIAPHKLFSFTPLKKITVGLYHSWVVTEADFPDCLTITSRSREGHIMSIRHRKYDVHGVQFHPESYMTTCGKDIIAAFLM